MSTTAPAVSPAAPAFDWANPTPEQLEAAAAFIAQRNARRVARDAYEDAKDAAERAQSKARHAATSPALTSADKGAATRARKRAEALSAEAAALKAGLPALKGAAEAEAQAEAAAEAQPVVAQIEAATQIRSVTRRAAHFAFTLEQSIPDLALSRREEMALLGISEEDFADRAHDLPLVEVEQPELPLYRETPGADVQAYKSELALLWQATKRARMDESKRIEGAAKYLGIPALTSWKQLTPELMRRLRHAIQSGHLTRDWAPAKPGAVAARELPGVDEEDFARIVD